MKSTGTTTAPDRYPLLSLLCKLFLNIFQRTLVPAERRECVPKSYVERGYQSMENMKFNKVKRMVSLEPSPCKWAF